jgi:hypothetical protein
VQWVSVRIHHTYTSTSTATNLEIHQPQRVQPARVTDRHVVARPNRRAGHHRARADAQEWDVGFQDSFADGVEQLVSPELLEEAEGVAPPCTCAFGRWMDW